MHPNKCRHGFETTDDCCAICCLESELEAANSRIEDGDQTISDLEAENAQLTTALADARAELSKARGEVGRLNRFIELIPGKHIMWKCPDCDHYALNGRKCCNCGLNHPMQAKTLPLSSLDCPAFGIHQYTNIGKGILGAVTHTCKCGAIKPSMIPEPS